MIPWLLLAGLGVAEAKPRKAKAEPPPVEEVVVVAPTLPSSKSPLDRDRISGWLVGETASMDLEKMTRSTVTYGVAVDRRWMSRLDAVGRERLWRYLEHNPSWRVTQEHGVRVALRRVPEGSEWVSSRDGLEVLDGRAWRVAFRDTVWPAFTGWASAKDAARVGPEDGKVSLPAWVITDGPWYGARASALMVDANGLGLDVLEIAPEGGRALTVEALRHASRAIDDVADGRDDPARSAAPGTYIVIQASDASHLDLRARVSPPGPGWTWIRLVTDEGPWSDAEVAAGTLERVGFGEGGAYWMQGRFPVAPGEGFQAVGEVWHQPDGTTEAILLGSWPVAVPAR